MQAGEGKLYYAGSLSFQEIKNLLVPDDFPRDQMPALVAPEFRKDILLIVDSEDNRTPP